MRRDSDEKSLEQILGQEAPYRPLRLDQRDRRKPEAPRPRHRKQFLAVKR